MNTYKRLIDKIGTPTKEYTTNGKITGAKWEIPFKEKNKLKWIFSRPTIIGNM